jgi:fatty-acyl-CoA synthase
MHGLMMDTPLLITSLMRFADAYHPRRQIVSITADNPLHRTTYGEAFRRTRQLAGGLKTMGIERGDRVATLAWNDYRHFEIYYATSCSGAVCHTVNPRLFKDQINYILNHAEDRVIFTDPAFVPLLEDLAGGLSSVEEFVILTDEAHMPQTSLRSVICYESLIAAQEDHFEWPDLDERTAAALCYTSGTTGHPKGVLYSHRSTVLHAYSICLPDAAGISARHCVLPVVPMFHVCAWGVPYAAPMVGAKLILPGCHMRDGQRLHELVVQEGVTCALGVPTVWLALLEYLQETGNRLDGLERIVVGGAACPPAMLDAFQDQYGVEVHHAWGMTETSPLGTFNRFKPGMERLPANERRRIQYSQGRGAFGIEMKITDDENRELPWDGYSAGKLKVRGPFVASSYFETSAAQGKPQHDDRFEPEGWFDTGDVATIDPEGYMRIVDRAKDLIKSGGEWISSIELENEAVAHPQIAAAAVIAIPHPRWGERPLLVAVRTAEQNDADPLSRQQVLDWLTDRVAKWWLPDDVVFVDELPLTATGKINKRALRNEFANSDT